MLELVGAWVDGVSVVLLDDVEALGDVPLVVADVVAVVPLEVVPLDAVPLVPEEDEPAVPVVPEVPRWPEVPLLAAPDEDVEAAALCPGKALLTYTVATPIATAVPTPIQRVADRSRSRRASRARARRRLARAGASAGSGRPPFRGRVECS